MLVCVCVGVGETGGVCYICFLLLDFLSLFTTGQCLFLGFVLGEAYRSLTGVFFNRIFSVAISVSTHVCFTLDLILISMFLR